MPKETIKVDHPALTSHVGSLINLNAQAKWVESMQKEIKGQITALMEGEFPNVKVETPEGTVVMVPGSNSRVDPGILLEQGVLPAVIEKAKKVTKFVYPKVVELGAENV